MKITVFLLSLVSFSVFASPHLTEDQKKIEEQKNIQMLKELGLPLPGSGIKLVPRAMLGLSEEQLKKGVKAEEDMKTLGYSLQDTNRPANLLRFRHYAKMQFKTNINNASDTSTHLRENLGDLKLAFKFEGILKHNRLNYQSNSFLPEESNQHNDLDNDLTLIGVAPQGGFHEDKGGWSGVAQYFSSKKIGTCSYSVMNVKASNTAAELAMEDVTYVINNKATLITVEGKKGSGFIYEVSWYDEKNFHELECANMKYSRNTTNDVIALAKKIDSD
jgi:hypothetical protein